MTYLEDLLHQQQIDPLVEDALRSRRREIEAVLRHPHSPRFYYGGSLAKNTMIAAAFDLDLVVYYPHRTPASAKDLYLAVEQALRRAGRSPIRHNVSLRLQYTPGYHIDVVPGRALDETYHSADLYAAVDDTLRRTSLKLHIQLARQSDRAVIKLLKLWRRRNAIPLGSFLIELAAAQALRDCPRHLPLEDRLRRALHFLATAYPQARLIDPANPENIVTDPIHWSQKQAVSQAAHTALSHPWPQTIW